MAAVTAGIAERGGRAIWLAADCTVPADLERMTATVTEQLGPIEIVAAFAGGNGMPVPTAAETPEHWREVIETDLSSVFYTVRAVLPAMTGRGGAIVTMSSAAARQAAKSAAAYAAAKAGVIAFTRHLAGELAPARHPGQLRRPVRDGERQDARLDVRRPARRARRELPARPAWPA